MDAVDAALLANGVAVDKAALRDGFDARISDVLRSATLELPSPRRGIVGGRTGRHSEHLGHILAEMQFLPRSYPDASW
jgi:ring-1,2-phenylacetyl-CoA epoxidase subunit PaaC